MQWNHLGFFVFFSLLTFVVKVVLLFFPGQVLFKFILCFCFCILSVFFCLTHLLQQLLLLFIFNSLCFFIPVVHLYLCSLLLLHQAHSAPGLVTFMIHGHIFCSCLQRRSWSNFKTGISIGKLGWKKRNSLLTHLVQYNLIIRPVLRRNIQ